MVSIVTDAVFLLSRWHFIDQKKEKVTPILCKFRITNGSFFPSFPFQGFVHLAQKKIKTKKNGDDGN